MAYFPMPNSIYPPFPMTGRVPFQPSLAPPLYIGNLDETVYEEQLFAHFSRYGPLHSLKIVKDRVTNRSRGFGYINFVNAKDAENARQLAQYDKIGKAPIRLMYKRNIHDSEGTNIFVKNIDPTVTFKELHNLFARVGNVITVKIATNRRGESLGYGYVLMEKKEDADIANGQLNGFKLKEKEISCNAFLAKDKRVIRNNTNLYIKGLPVNTSKEDIQNMIYSEFSKHGKILSHDAQQSKDEKWFAFVCYEDSKSAEEAIKQLHNSYVFGQDPLYVAKHQSKHERDFELKKNYTAIKNENNLFVKNLKPEVTKEMLRHAFSEFGEIGNTDVKPKAIKPEDVRSHGFVSFKVPQDALKAQTDGPKSDEVRQLFIEDQEVYINFWQPKTQRDQFKASKTRRPFDQQRMLGFNGLPRGGNPFAQIPTDPRMMNFNPFQIMNPGLMRPPYSGPRTQNMPNRYQPRRGGYQSNRTFNQRPYVQNNDRYGRPFRPYQGNRPGQGNDYYGQQNQRAQQQHVHPTQTHQQPKEPRAVAQQQDVALEVNLTVQSLKDKLDDFLKLEPEKQRNILGELLFPKILKRSRQEHAPKITGMLVDFDVLTVQDILEMLEDEQILDERVQEAQDLIISEGQN